MTRNSTVQTWAVIAAVALASFWLRHGFPVFALGPVFHDDALFIKLARSICSGNWLGEYNNLTLAKGAGYPAFVCGAHATGIPLKMAEHALYLFAALYFSSVAGYLFTSRGATAMLFAVLAFNPVFWAPEIGGRVIRENLYLSLSLLLLALCLRAYVTPWERVYDKRRLATLVATGLCGAVYWLTREEGVWLAPALAILAGWGFHEAWKAPGIAMRQRVARVFVLIAVPSLAFALVVGAVNTVNLVQYGTFRNNDFRSSDFQSAYGALARIQHDNWRAHVVFPADARARAYAASAAARELQPFLDGSGGEIWRQTGCPAMTKAECPEIPSGWFIWALRDAVTAAGHHATATKASLFYLRLAAEVNAACESRAIACGAGHASLMPPWRSVFLPMTLETADEMFLALSSLGLPRVSIEASMGTEAQIAAFQQMIHGRIARQHDVVAAGERLRARLPLARALADLEVGFTAIALPVAIGAWFALLAFSQTRRQWHRGHLLSAALLAAVAMRVALLAFLDATSIPVNQSLYPSPAVPMALVFAPCVALLAWRLRSQVSCADGEIPPRTAGDEGPQGGGPAALR